VLNHALNAPLTLLSTMESAYQIAQKVPMRKTMSALPARTHADLALMESHAYLVLLDSSLTASVWKIAQTDTSLIKIIKIANNVTLHVALAKDN
jgi:hypothetical protein